MMEKHERLMELAEQIELSLKIIINLKPSLEFMIICACRHIMEDGNPEYHGRQLMELLLESDSTLAMRYAQLLSYALYGDKKGAKAIEGHMRLLKGSKKKKQPKTTKLTIKRPKLMRGWKVSS